MRTDIEPTNRPNDELLENEKDESDELDADEPELELGSDVRFAECLSD